MTTSDQSAARSRSPQAQHLRARAGVDVELAPWIPHGVAAGALGAAVVAVFFLAMDLAAGRPFWTPSALGSAFFRGSPFPVDAAPEPVLIVGYTAMHGAVFVSIGLIAAYVLASRPRQLAPAGLGLAGLLFLAFEVVFFVYTLLFDAKLIVTYGFGNAAAANLLAAGFMATYLMRFAHAPAAELPQSST